MLENILDNIENTMVAINLCFFIALITVKQTVSRAEKAVTTVENYVGELCREDETLAMELSHITDPKRLKIIYYSLARDDDSEHIANINEMTTIDNLLLFQRSQRKNIQISLPQNEFR
ncbi:MAG: hypothetical protein LBB13_01120 [Rickettsiales bacterium]|nr:hypothetical protein [Rickettsiales bacterium]